jgi:MFS family permease
MAGVYTIAESLLNILASRSNRGRLYGVYMTVSWLTAAASPVAVMTEGGGGVISFLAAGAIILVAVLPVLATRRATLPVPSAYPVSLGHFRAVPPAALTICFGSGVINGGLHGLLPSYAVESGLGNSDLSLMLAVASVAGIAGQFPVGHFSDKARERVGVAKIVIVLGFALSMALFMFSGAGFTMLLMLFGMLTAIMAPVYGLGAALANDRSVTGCAVATTGALLFVNGIGNAIGPLGAGFAMGAWGANSLFLFLATSAAIIAIVIAAEKTLDRAWMQAPSRR